ncbi:GFA family protein [Aliiroseovarius sp. YM-037]|uniref:GFA family protein n=1 Tax=Aliiroseovarius sp. YM-037 TaxID=3341728 RepID=UPI003A8124C4
MNDSGERHAGGCLCGAVRYEVNGPLRGVVNCHCTMCQKLHGAFGAHTKADKGNITILESRGLRWYASSDRARRGFCGECGSSLFWEPVNQPGTGILAGSLDQPAGLRTIGHIFVGEKCKFTEIAGNAPRFEESSAGALDGDEL